jgi:hypothetical protein
MRYLTDDQFDRVLAALLADSEDHSDEDNAAVVRDACALWRPHYLPVAEDAADSGDMDDDGMGEGDPIYAAPRPRA